MWRAIWKQTKFAHVCDRANAGLHREMVPLHVHGFLHSTSWSGVQGAYLFLFIVHITYVYTLFFSGCQI